MATARFAAMLEGIALKKDVKLTLVLTNPDEVLPNLVPMRSGRVVVIMQTEQQEIDDYNRSLPPQGQQMTFDQSSFQVPRYEGPDLGDGEETAEGKTEELVDCPECGNLEPARQDCKICKGFGMVPVEQPAEPMEQAETDAAAPAGPEPQAEAAAGEEPDYWTLPEPYVKPEQVKDEKNPQLAAGES